jgi:DNA-binding transcriptional MerR regulator
VPKETKHLLRIGELAHLTKVSTRTIRFYVEEGLLPKPVKTNRNMAYYDPECIPKIKAIKKAQTERFLPLVVIGQMLEKSGHDFSVLERGGSACAQTESFQPIDWSKKLVNDLQRRRWVSRKNIEKPGSADNNLLGFFSRSAEMGFDTRELAGAFESIERLIEKAVRTEFRVFFSRLGQIPPDIIDGFLAHEKQVAREFMLQVRERALRDLLTRRNRRLDSAVLAIGDEGYGIPLDAISDDLLLFEKRSRRHGSDPRLLIDLATGYSCAGDQQKAMGFLRRALRRNPEDVAARVRWCWYNRFATDKKCALQWRDRLEALVNLNPADTAGRVFLAVWFAFDSTEAPDSFASLQLINRCLKEIERAAEIEPADLHDWTLRQYAIGLVYTFILSSLQERAKGMQAFEAILARRFELEAYYAGRMPFFPKWLWPNLLYFYGLARLGSGFREDAAMIFREALSFNMSDLFRQRVSACLACSEKTASQDRTPTRAKERIR